MNIMRHSEFHFDGFNGASLFAQSWQNNVSSTFQANIIVTTGQGEHSECYQPLAESLVPKGYNIYAWDLEGHGRSSGKRGHIEDFSHHCHNLYIFIQNLKKTVPNFKDSPFFLYLIPWEP